MKLLVVLICCEVLNYLILIEGDKICLYCVVILLIDSNFFFYNVNILKELEV